MINYQNCEWFKVGGINLVLLATLYVDHCKQYCNYLNRAMATVYYNYLNRAVAFMINYHNCEWFKVGAINLVLLATHYVDHCKQYFNCHNIAVEF